MNRQTPEWFIRADRRLLQIYKGITYLAALCLIAIMLIAFINVCGEKLAKAGVGVSGINNASDWIAYLHVPIVFLSASFIALERGHTCVDILTNKFHPVVQRITSYFSAVAGAAITAFMSWRGITKLLPELIKVHTTINNSSFSFPQWPFALTYCIGMTLLCLAFLWLILRLVFNYSPPLPVDESMAPDPESEGGVEA